MRGEARVKMSNAGLKSNGGSGFAMGVGDGQSWDQVVPGNGVGWDQADSADQYEAANIIKEAPVVSRSANDG